MAAPEDSNPAMMNGQAQPQPATNAAPISKEMSMEQARASAEALMQQQQELVERINTYIQVMQNPQVGMQEDAKQLMDSLNKLDAENDKNIADMNNKAMAMQKKRAMTSLAVSLVAGTVAAVGAHFLGARKIENNKRFLKLGTYAAAGSVGGVIPALFSGKLMPGDKAQYQLANDMMGAMTSVNDSLSKLCTETEQKLQQKLTQISAGPAAPQQQMTEHSPPPMSPAPQQPAMAGAVAGMGSDGMQSPTMANPTAVPPLANFQEATGEPLVQRATGIS